MDLPRLIRSIKLTVVVPKWFYNNSEVIDFINDLLSITDFEYDIIGTSEYDKYSELPYATLSQDEQLIFSGAFDKQTIKSLFLKLIL